MKCISCISEMRSVLLQRFSYVLIGPRVIENRVIKHSQIRKIWPAIYTSLFIPVAEIV
jgi:hypothetical protein